MKNFIKLQFITLLLLGSHSALAYDWANDDLILEIPDKEIVLSKDDVSKWLNIKPSLKYFEGYHSEIENTDFCPVAKIICDLSKIERRKYATKKIQIQSFDDQKIKSFLEKLSAETKKNPTNATFKVDGEKVSNFSLSADGYELDKEKSLINIFNFLSNEQLTNKLKLSFNIIEPEIKDNDADKLGIKELIGEGRSNFTGSTLSRIHNIRVATDRFDGLLIKPKEEFSFVKILGEVDGEHGYKQELVIKKGVTEPEFGGGICQVSTTTFRAAINAGLEITARKNHAYPVHYYNPQGMDAAVYVPNPDLKFINNTPGYILIKTELNVEKKELVFKFYGTNDGRKVEIDAPKVLSRESDGAMKTVFHQKVTDSKGNIILDVDFNSNYKSPNDYPKPGELLTSKPRNWSNKEWQEYKKDNKIP